jgi:hypothetical protein
MPNLSRNLKRFLLAACAVVPCACQPGARETPIPRTVVQVSYIESSGSVLDPWTERYLITDLGIRFIRNGAVDGPINEGTWEFGGQREAIARLFEQLTAVDCSSIQEIPPDELLDGGGSTSYEVLYSDESVCGAWYREGYTYAGADPLVRPIDDLVGGLSLPVEAVERFRSP